MEKCIDFCQIKDRLIAFTVCRQIMLTVVHSHLPKTHSEPGKTLVVLVVHTLFTLVCLLSLLFQQARDVSMTRTAAIHCLPALLGEVDVEVFKCCKVSYSQG